MVLLFDFVGFVYLLSIFIYVHCFVFLFRWFCLIIFDFHLYLLYFSGLYMITLNIKVISSLLHLFKNYYHYYFCAQAPTHAHPKPSRFPTTTITLKRRQPRTHAHTRRWHLKHFHLKLHKSSVIAQAPDFSLIQIKVYCVCV